MAIVAGLEPETKAVGSVKVVALASLLVSPGSWPAPLLYSHLPTVLKQLTSAFLHARDRPRELTGLALPFSMPAR